jgi:hypothetical protein
VGINLRRPQANDTANFASTRVVYWILLENDTAVTESVLYEHAERRAVPHSARESATKEDYYYTLKARRAHSSVVLITASARAGERATVGG